MTRAYGHGEARKLTYFSGFVGLDFLFAVIRPVALFSLWLTVSLPRYSQVNSGVASGLFLVTAGILFLLIPALVYDLVKNFGLLSLRDHYRAYRRAADAYANSTAERRAKIERPEFRLMLPMGLLRRVSGATLWKETLYFLAVFLILLGVFLLSDSLGRLAMALLIGTIASASYMASTKTQINIVPLELAFTAETASGIIQKWKAIPANQGMLDARTNVRRDFLFILFYTATLSLFVYLAYKNIGTATPFHIAGTWFIGAALIAGLLDAIENLLLLRMMATETLRSPWPQITSIVAAIKFLLLILAIVYVGWWLIPTLI